MISTLVTSRSDDLNSSSNSGEHSKSLFFSTGIAIAEKIPFPLTVGVDCPKLFYIP
jgi:hypothetical protein